MKKRERKEKICQDLFEHTTKNKEEIQKKKFEKHSQKNHFLKKLLTKEIGKHIFFDEKTRKIAFHVFEKELQTAKTHKKKNKRKEKNKKGRKDTIKNTQKKPKRKKFKNRERNKKPFLQKKKKDCGR